MTNEQINPIFDIYKMKLHETKSIHVSPQTSVQILKVPGGWIYKYYHSRETESTVFIPQPVNLGYTEEDFKTLESKYKTALDGYKKASETIREQSILIQHCVRFSDRNIKDDLKMIISINEKFTEIAEQIKYALTLIEYEGKKPKLVETLEQILVSVGE